MVKEKVSKKETVSLLVNHLKRLNNFLCKHDSLFKKEFLPARTAAGLRHVSFHSLRHSFTSLGISLGWNIKFLQSQLGHGSVQTTLDRYGHLLPVDQINVGKEIDERMRKARENNDSRKQKPEYASSEAFGGLNTPKQGQTALNNSKIETA